MNAPNKPEVVPNRPTQPTQPEQPPVQPTQPEQSPEGVKTEDVKVETPPAIELPKMAADEKFTPSERMPSDWEIRELDGELIEAVSNRSGRRFVGTRKEFSAKLRG